jgi:hypothetical protein
MKNIQALALTVLILLISSYVAIRIKQEKFDWEKTKSKDIDGKTNVVVHYLKNKMSKDNLSKALKEIPRDFELGDKDVIVVSTEAIYWFVSKSAKDKRNKLNVSGGLLGGVWELAKTQVSSTEVTYAVRPENKSNQLLDEEAMSIVGEYNDGGSANTKVLWGLQEARDAKESKTSGIEIESNDGGIYAGSGIKLEFKGAITNQLATAVKGSVAIKGKMDNFASNKDTDPSGESGSAEYTITWRIAADKPELAFMISFKSLSGKFPIASARADFVINGKVKTVSAVNPSNSVDVAYEAVAAPELMIGNATTNLSNVDVNKYFTNSCVKSLYNYEFKETSKEFAVKSPPGRGQVMCLGAPVHKISFMCAYPNNDNLPKEAYEDYYMTMTEKKVNDKTRKITLSYNLLKTKPVEVDSSRNLALGMRLKFIDATPALA